MAIATKTKKLDSGAKKRSGLHHHHSKDYRRAYWPYLPMLLIVALGLFINNFWSHQGHVLGASSNLSPTSLLAATNVDRQANQETALALNPELTQAAQTKAENMVSENYWSHDSPEGKTPWDFITAAGYDYQTAGENLAYGFSSANATLTAWMNSPEHRANILDTNYQDVGFGIASSEDFVNQGPEVVIVAMYASPVAAAANITFTVPYHHTTATTATPALDSSSRLVSRLELLSGSQSSWLVILVSALSGAALAAFIIRHGLRLKRMFKSGEKFLLHHPSVDILLVVVFTVGYLVTRSGGVIH